MPDGAGCSACGPGIAAVALAGYCGPLGGPCSGPVENAVQRRARPAAQPLQDRAGRRRRAGPRLRARRVPAGPPGELRSARPRVPERPRPRRSPRLVLIGLAVPHLSGQVLQPGSFSLVPRLLVPGGRLPRRQLAGQTALVVPADAHGLYLWGDPIDDPLEPLATSPWAERGARALRRAGSQVFLDTAEQAVESGQAVPGLPGYLDRAGIRYVVVRNDLDPAAIGYVSPQIVNQTLALSGFERVASFGPRSRPPPATCSRSRRRRGPRPATRRWRSSRRPTRPGGRRPGRRPPGEPHGAGQRRPRLAPAARRAGRRHQPARGDRGGPAARAAEPVGRHRRTAPRRQRSSV